MFHSKHNNNTVYNFFIFIVLLYGTDLYSVPNPNALKKIYNIRDAVGIDLIKFPEYEDTVAYGAQPNALDSGHLKTLNSTFDWNNPQSYGIKSLKNTYVAKLHSAFTSPRQLGTVFDYQQEFLFDIKVAPGIPIFWNLQQDVMHMAVLYHDKLATVQGPTLYYHWVIDRLPSILLLRKFILQDPTIKLVIHNQHNSVAGYVHEYLHLLGIPSDQVIVANSNALYHAETLYFATPFLMEPIPKKLLSELRSELIEAAYQKPSSREYKNNLVVIIQRREADRRILNLAELVRTVNESFAHKGYEILIFDASMSVSEQIKIFNNARLIIGVMASGLTNVLYANPGASVIEIHPELAYLANPQGINDSGCEWCWWLSSIAGANYWVVPTRFTFADSHVTVPLEPMKKILKQIVEKQEKFYEIV